MNPLVESFFDPATSTFSHVAYDCPGGHGVVIDPVLDFDAAAARTGTAGADRILEFVARQGLTVPWILETHAHGDHLTAAAYLRERLGARVAIGRGIAAVQAHFKALFNLEPGFAADGSQFDQLFGDGDSFAAGALRGYVLATPGHTDDSLTYVIGDAAFVGDTVFAPDTGTARCDFPGGDAARLYGSIQKLFALPPATRLFLCHDYPPGGRAPLAQVAVAEQVRANVHVGGQASAADFVQMRRTRDATLPVPKLILPSLQVNIRAGQLPPPDDNGIRYLRLPLDQLGGG